MIYRRRIFINRIYTKRDSAIDILRGIAVFTMVEANMGAELLLKNPPLLLRLYGSFAAPIFILISGMMISYACKNRKHTFLYFLKKGALLILIATLIDILIMRVLPFTSMDVLYLIGLSMPLAYLFEKMDLPFEMLIITLVFSLTPFLQYLLGYTSFPLPLSIKDGLYQYPLFKVVIQKRWIIDGWFPIFPWIGFSFLGIILGKLRIRYGNFKNQLFLLFGIVPLALGSFIWARYPGKLLIRGGYSELFYPPTLGYIIFSIGLIFLLFFIVDYTANNVIYKPFITLGQYSLQIYIFHIALGNFFKHAIGPQSILSFILIYILTITSIIIILRLLKRATFIKL